MACLFFLHLADPGAGFQFPLWVLKPPSQRCFPSTLGKSWLARKFPPVFSGSIGAILWFVIESLGGDLLWVWLPSFRTHKLKAHKLLCGLFETSLLWVRWGHFPRFPWYFLPLGSALRSDHNKKDETYRASEPCWKTWSKVKVSGGRPWTLPAQNEKKREECCLCVGGSK